MVGALVLLAAILLAWPNPLGPPTTLHVWGHDFNSAGENCEGDPPFIDLCDAPPPAAPVTKAEMNAKARDEGLDAIVLHEQPGVLGWYFGLTDGGTKPTKAEWTVYLQVGSDAYIPYRFASFDYPHEW